jgi:hypothetical protein
LRTAAAGNRRKLRLPRRLESPSRVVADATRSFCIVVHADKAVVRARHCGAPASCAGCGDVSGQVAAPRTGVDDSFDVVPALTAKIPSVVDELRAPRLWRGSWRGLVCCSARAGHGTADTARASPVDAATAMEDQDELFSTGETVTVFQRSRSTFGIVLRAIVSTRSTCLGAGAHGGPDPHRPPRFHHRRGEQARHRRPATTSRSSLGGRRMPVRLVSAAVRRCSNQKVGLPHKP